jgi:ATP-dependent Clp protease ATP-binding subunit ClpA
VFERFSPAARQVVVRAQGEARGLAHPWIGCEHLLLGVMVESDSQAVAVLTDAGVTADRVRHTLEQVVGRGGFCAEDAAALRSVGIDLDQVRRAAETSFGPGALDRPLLRRCRRRSVLRRRRRRIDDVSGEVPFLPRAKRALERARDEADRGTTGTIDVDHLALGLLDPKGNMAVELVRRLGADPEQLSAQLRARLDNAA